MIFRIINANLNTKFMHERLTRSMDNDNPFLNNKHDNIANMKAPSTPVQASFEDDDNESEYQVNDDDFVEADNDNMQQIGTVRSIGKKSNLNDLKNQSISDDELMDLFTADDRDDTSTDYDGDGTDNDLDGEPDGE